MVRTLNTCGTVRKRYIKVDLTCENNYEASITINRGQILSSCKLSNINNAMYDFEPKPTVMLMQGSWQVWWANVGMSTYSGYTEPDNSVNRGATTTYRVKFEINGGPVNAELKERLAERPPMSVVFTVC